MAESVGSRAEGMAVESMAESGLESTPESVESTPEGMAVESMAEKRDGRRTSFGDRL